MPCSEEDIVAIEHIVDNIWTVTFSSINKLESVLGGRTFRIIANSGTEAREMAINRCKNLFRDDRERIRERVESFFR